MDAETNIYRDSFFAALQRLNAGEIGDTPLTEEDGERIILEGAANILDQKVEKGSLQKKDVTSQPEYVQPLVDYVEEDFTAFRLMTQDTLEKQHAAPVGGMIVCDSSEQAQAVQKELARRGHFHKDSEGELALADGYYEKRNRTLHLQFSRIAIPSPDILQNFAKTMKPIHQRMITNKQENRRLTQLRDFLLPLLMNGQVTFK